MYIANNEKIMRIDFLTLICIFSLGTCALLPSCTKGEEVPQEQTETPDQPAGPDETTPPEKPEKPEEPAGPDPAVYPEGVNVTEHSFKHDDGTSTRYFVGKVDVKKNPKLKFHALFNSPKKTPSQNYKEFDFKENIPYIITNAGYFAAATSMSLVIKNSFCEAVAPFNMSWPNAEHPKYTIHPVRAAFGQMKDGSFRIDWVFCCDPAGRIHYSFPSALDNNEKTETFMKEGPTPNTPGAEKWQPVNAVGGGPMLVHDGKDVAMENYWKECLNSGGTAGASHVQRTGIGLDKDGNPIVIVCEGRKINNSTGLTLSELAQVFIEQGAVSAMNLDGGGSSAFIGKGGKRLTAGSSERKVVSSLAFSLDVKTKSGN